MEQPQCWSVLCSAFEPATRQEAHIAASLIHGQRGLTGGTGLTVEQDSAAILTYMPAASHPLLTVAQLQAQSDLTIIALIALGALLGIAGTWFWIRRQQQQQITSLLAALRNIRRGSDRLPVSGHGLVAQLASQINTVLDLLETLEHTRHGDDADGSASRGEFIDLICHELRTPLTPAAGFVDLLLSTNTLSATQRRYLDLVRTYLQQMSSLVDDLLDLSRLETQGVTLQREPTDIRTLIEQAATSQAGELTRKQMHLVIELPAGLPLVSVDRRRVTQVLDNLLSNAVKYTYPRGTITVLAERQTDGSVAVHIRDTGIGMTAEQQQRLFTRFYRAESPLRDSVPGTGLGLTIARSFVQLHGGELTVESAPGRGSTFSFTLPPSL